MTTLTQPLAASDTLGNMSIQSSAHAAPSSGERKVDFSYTTSTMQSAAAPTVAVDARLFAQMQQMLLANQLATAPIQNLPRETVLQDGSKYIGPTNKDGQPHGYGSVTYPAQDDRLDYVGEFQNGVRTQGKIRWRTGDSYEGSFTDDKATGRGKLTFPPGNSNSQLNYDGEVQAGWAHGRGIMRWTDGAIHEGLFQKGNMEGQGKQTMRNGDYKLGVFQKGALWEGDHFRNFPQGGSGTTPYKNGAPFYGCCVIL